MIGAGHALRGPVEGLHDIDRPRHPVPLVGLVAGDDEEGKVDDPGERYVRNVH